MPGGQGKIPLRSVRVPDETWQAAQKRAAEKGEPLSEVIRRALERYARSGGGGAEV